MKKGTLKTVAVVLAFLLLGTAVVACMTQGFSDWNPYGWFDTTKDCEHEYGEDGKCTKCGEEKQETACVMSITPHNVEGLSLLYAPLSVANSVETLSSTEETTTAQVIATLISGKTNQVAWSLAFKDASSTWASGKTVSDYVEYSMSADTFTVTLTCKAAFGEIIILTCTALEANLTATCNIEYSQKVVDVSNGCSNTASTSGCVVLKDGYGDYEDSKANALYGKKYSYAYCSVDLSPYTTASGNFKFLYMGEPPEPVSNVTLTLDTRIGAEIVKYGLDASSEVNFNESVTLPFGAVRISDDIIYGYFDIGFSDFLSAKDGASQSTKNAIEAVRSFIKDDYNGNKEKCGIVITFSCTYNFYSKDVCPQCRVYAGIDTSQMAASTSTLTLNSSEVIF